MAKRKPATRCKDCGYVIKPVPGSNNGWGHKKRSHWLDKPHKAVPEVIS